MFLLIHVSTSSTWDQSLTEPEAYTVKTRFTDPWAPGALLSPPPALNLKAHAITASFPMISEDPNSGPHAAQKYFAHYAISPAPSVSLIPCQMANHAIGMYIWIKTMYMGFRATSSFTNPPEVLGRVGGR